jgi:hypothetical protein
MADDLLLLVNGTDNLLLVTGDDLLLASSTEVAPGPFTVARTVTFNAGTEAVLSTLNRAGKHIRVTNMHATAIVYFTVASNTAGPGAVVTAVAAADDTYPCPAASSVRVPSAGGSQAVVSLISDTATTPVSIETFDMIPDHHGRYD